MQLTDYQAKYLAWELTRRCPSDSLEKLASAVAGAQVDLNPHQVDAALFAFRSPLSRGALLADEVGLGKTIEAGLVIAQKWAEHRRRILIITPASLRKQWYQELTDKFFLPCVILESKSYNAEFKANNFEPFERDDQIVICSYQFAARMAADVKRTEWDLVVIDEAHRLRNVYKPANVMSNRLKVILAGRNKLLLTATPLQNSLMELYGLVSFIDETAFGDVKSFKEQFANGGTDDIYGVLKERLRPLCHRTLRRQVAAHIPFTRRHAMLQEFTPADDEEALYNMVSEYLRRDNLIALPKSQRTLITLVLRKLLASSTFAIAGALQGMANRLRVRMEQRPVGTGLDEELGADYEALDETADEWDDDKPEVLTEADREALELEIKDLDAFAALAKGIGQNAKGEKLVVALELAFAKATELGAPHKAIIFTESCRTQEYLLKRLASGPHGQHIVLFNGKHNDERAKRIYATWLKRHQGTDRVTGSKTADMRSALVDYFREEGRIMIATEAGAEGINLQFCSLVVNYDLPWNPQRIEQRIGRCHRYGQKHDVVVVNFVNRANEADRRVYELLEQKFQLFEGVFGASDEILGAIESGVDFEKRIADIYQRCRKPEEIAAAFDELQRELSIEIDESMRLTRRKLLENFDDEVREKLKVADRDSKEVLNLFERRLMELTQHELAGCAQFLGDSAFRLDAVPHGAAATIVTGLYELPRRTGEAHTYRLNHPLAEFVVDQAKHRSLAAAHLVIDYAAHDGRVFALEPWRGRTGSLAVTVVTIQALNQTEDYLLFAAVADDGTPLDDGAARRLLSLPATVIEREAVINYDRLDDVTGTQMAVLQRRIAERNVRYYDAESDKLDAWADDLKVGLERELKDLDRQIKEAKRDAKLQSTLEDKLAAQRKVRSLEATRNQKRRALFDAQDDVDRKREELIAMLEGKLEQDVVVERVVVIGWELG
jgi:superfamily II DNA or RNA helicase